MASPVDSGISGVPNGSVIVGQSGSGGGFREQPRPSTPSAGKGRRPAIKITTNGETPGAPTHDQGLAATFAHAGVGLAEVDAAGTLLRANAQLCALIGYAAQELVGRSLFDFSSSEDVAFDRGQFERQVKGEIDRYTVEKRIRRKDGSYLWAEITSTSVRADDGSFLYAVRVQHDITELKRAREFLYAWIDEQAALHELAKRLQQAVTPEDVYEPAMDAIVRGLRCRRASILLFDGAGVMRFVASRGLSERYRRAVDGHSPWSADTANPEPIWIDDVWRSDLPEDLKQIVRAEGIGALAFIPLRDGSRLLGKFMAYYDAPHVFTRAEIELAMTIGHQLGSGVQRKRAERAALQLAAIVESSDDAIISKDLSGTITSWNNGAERLYGYTAAEAIGQPVLMLIPEDRLNEESGILDKIRRGERIEHYETVRRRKDGRFVDVSLTVSPVRDAAGSVTGASKIARDISDRKAAEAERLESERQLQELLAAIPAAIYTTDAQGKITYFNDAAVEMAGRTPVLGSDEWCVTWKLYLPDGTPLPHDQCPMAVALREGRAIRNVEAVAERPDGTRIPFIPYPTPLRDQHGTVVGAINMLVDVSERKQAETQQQVLLAELNHRVKNNMQTIQSLLHAAARQTNSLEARKVLGEASSRIAAMAAAQRILYGSTGATRFNAEAFVNTVCETVRQTFSAEIAIHCDAMPDELPNDHAMPLALILNELLTNAAKHGSDGGKGAIRVGLRRDGDHFILYVEDDGPGFELGAVAKRASGLQLVQGLARQLRGDFSVSRAPASRCTLRFI
jgi:PAS domain S-box-containing protein